MKEIIDDPEQSKLFMIMEYCEGGEIKWQDGQERPALTVAETRRIFRETLLGLEYCEWHCHFCLLYAACLHQR
jgi:[calcium/calmodulin-dependent protein kinase] kinase